MRVYRFYEHPKYGQKIEKEGFTSLGLFFTVFWLIPKRLYLPSVVFLLLCIAPIVGELVLTHQTKQQFAAYLETPYETLAERRVFQQKY